MKRRMIAVLLENEAGALSRIVGLFAQRNYNIETLSVAPTEDEELSRLTITLTGDDAKIEQVIKHLNRLIEVLKVSDLTDGAHVERGIMLIKVRAQGAARAEVKRSVEIFKGRIIDVTPRMYTIEFMGSADKFSAFIATLEKRNIVEVVRSGLAGISRGEKALGL